MLKIGVKYKFTSIKSSYNVYYTNQLLLLIKYRYKYMENTTRYIAIVNIEMLNFIFLI